MKYDLTNALNIFRNAGFSVLDIEHTDLSSTDEKKTRLSGKTTNKGQIVELDGIVINCHVVLLIEYTNSKNLDTLDFDNFINKISLLSDGKKDKLAGAIDKVWQKYNPEDIDKPSVEDETVLIGLYIAPFLNENQEETLKQRITSVNTKRIFLWGRDTFEYFSALSSITRENSRYELYSYFSLEPRSVFTPEESRLQKSYIPEPFIDIKNGMFGCRMIIFKATPSVLLNKTYVLRNEGWKSDSFQRMIMSEKLERIREYIIHNRDASFANNIIVSLDPGIDQNALTETKDGILLPNYFGSFCIIDGQHRLLAFTQDFYSQLDSSEKKNDQVIKEMREKEEIIVTLLIFKGSPRDILRKQTQLFRDINATQTKVKSDFIYNLEEIINPKSPEAVGNAILKHLSKREDGVFCDRFSIKWYQGGRIKRSSVVRWGLRELVDPKKNFIYRKISKSIESLYSKGSVDEYVLFCSDLLEGYFLAVRDTFKRKYPEKDFWDFPAKNKIMLLSTSSIVGFLRLFRHFIFSGIKKTDYGKYLKEIKVNFKKEKYQFTSSQWAKLEEVMFDDIRGKYKDFGDEDLIKRQKTKPRLRRQ